MANSVENFGVSNRTIEAFHMMWDSFPHPVLLLEKSRDIVAVNKRGKERWQDPCMKCFQLSGGTKVHDNCKANKALEEGAVERSTRHSGENRVRDAYWLPVSAEEDLYLHFAIDIEPPPKN